MGLASDLQSLKSFIGTAVFDFINIFWRRVVFYLILLFFTVLFLVPAQLLPEEPIFHWWDKAQHAAVFIVLGFFGAMAYPRVAYQILVGLLFYGALIELLQSLTNWRQGDLYDWYADACGIAVVWLIYSVLRRPTARKL